MIKIDAKSVVDFVNEFAENLNFKAVEGTEVYPTPSVSEIPGETGCVSFDCVMGNASWTIAANLDTNMIDVNQVIAIDVVNDEHNPVHITEKNFSFHSVKMAIDHICGFVAEHGGYCV